MIFNANNLFADRPWNSLGMDRETLLARVGQRGLTVEREAPQLRPGQRRTRQRVVDPRRGGPDPRRPRPGGGLHAHGAARAKRPDLPRRVRRRRPGVPGSGDVRAGRAHRTRDRPAQVVLRQEHAPQPRARADHVPARAGAGGRPAKLYYAFPADQALTAVAKPYWFDAAGEARTVTRDVTTLPGHKVVEVEFSGIGAAAPEPYPAPPDTDAAHHDRGCVTRRQRGRLAPPAGHPRPDRNGRQRGCEGDPRAACRPGRPHPRHRRHRPG